MAPVQRNSPFDPEGWCPAHVTFCFLLLPFLLGNDEIKKSNHFQELSLRGKENCVWSARLKKRVCALQNNELVVSLLTWGAVMLEHSLWIVISKLKETNLIGGVGSIHCLAQNSVLFSHHWGQCFRRAWPSVRHIIVLSACLLDWTCVVCLQIIFSYQEVTWCKALYLNTGPLLVHVTPSPFILLI